MRVREFRLADLSAIATIRAASLALSRDFFTLTVDRARFDPFDEAAPIDSRILVAEGAAGEVLGYLHLVTNADQRRRGRAVLESLHVAPNQRRSGAGSALLHEAMAIAEGWGLRAIATALPGDQRQGADFLVHHGFEEARTFELMRLVQLEAPEPTFPEGYELRRFRPGQDEGPFAEAYNLAFADYWGFEPLAPEEVARWNRRRDFDPLGCFVLLAPGQEPVGFLTVLVDPNEAQELGEHVGRVYEMGVVPSHRRLGLGEQLVRAATRFAQAKGLDALELVTDAANGAGHALYARAGFSSKRSTKIFLCRLKGAGEAS